MEEEVVEDVVLFQNTSKMNEDEIYVFQKYELKRSIIGAVAFVIGISLLIGIPMCFLNIYAGVAIIVAGIIAGGVLMPYLMKDSVKKQNMLLFGEQKHLNNFDFKENSVLIVSKSTKDKESNDYEEVAREELSYLEFSQVVVYKTYLFLYLDQKQSFVINQRGMTKGTAGELVEFLITKGIRVIDKSKNVDESKIINSKNK